MQDVYYVSEEGKKKLEEELEYRSGELRRKISDQIGTAKDQGDLSENFEYQESKERQAQNEARVIALKEILAKTVVIADSEGASEIMIGTRFVVEKPDGNNAEFALVGSTEADPMAGKISNESPLGQAFFGKKKGDNVEVELPNGKVNYKIIEIR